MPNLRYTTFDGVVHTHELQAGTTRIGRTPDSDLQIDELAVSSRHCEIRYDGKSILVKDLDSVAGTYVDGQPVTESELKCGQVLSLGAFLVSVVDSKQPAPQSSAAALKPVPLADGSYSCLRHHDKRAAFECQECFDLACDDCVRLAKNAAGETSAYCKSCGALCRVVDWSGLDRTKKDVLKDIFIPKKVKEVMNLWDKHRDDLKTMND